MNGFHQHLSKSVLYLKNRQGWAVINSKWLDSGRLAEEKRVKICFGITIIYIYTTTAIKFIQHNTEQGGSVRLILICVCVYTVSMDNHFLW